VKEASLYERTRETAKAVGLYDNMGKLIPAVRAAHIQVFIVPHHRWREGAYKGCDFCCWNLGSEFHPEFGPREGDVVVLEHWAQSGFANTDLDSQLKQRGIQKIILVGMTANTCIEATARLGMDLGYHVTIIRDAIAASSHEGMHSVNEVNGPAFAHAILTTKELLACCLQNRNENHNQIFYKPIIKQEREEYIYQRRGT
jgi:nicotinamidase-related amidase